ncbi:MAG: GNAT family N-acetyltransferase [Anaerolineae bacterium]|nr:GNAT family N-acetyltransferase [Anaerolineae bacterium]
MTALEPSSLALTMLITLRTATRSDLPKLEWYGQYAHYRHIFQRAYREQQSGRRLILVADSNDFPIGHIFVQFIRPEAQELGGRAYLYSLRVMEMFQGHGIGTHLIGEAEKISAARGYEFTTIAAAKSNHGARRLYERLGYRVFGDDPGQWSFLDHEGKTRHVQEPCWLLQKELNLR